MDLEKKIQPVNPGKHTLYSLLHIRDIQHVDTVYPYNYTMHNIMY